MREQEIIDGLITRVNSGEPIHVAKPKLKPCKHNLDVRNCNECCPEPPTKGEK